jgi:hypothetical protein
VRSEEDQTPASIRGERRGSQLFALSAGCFEMSLEDVMAKYYAEERNIEISSFWDSGWQVRIGDRVSGFTKTSPQCELHEIEEWLNAAK